MSMVKQYRVDQASSSPSLPLNSVLLPIPNTHTHTYRHSNVLRGRAITPDRCV